MNKRFLIGALLVALSATGYAATVEEVRVIATTAQNNAAHALIQNSEQDRNIAALQSNKADVDFVLQQTDKVYNDLDAQKVDKSEFNDLQAHVDAVEADKDALREEVKDNKQELNDKIDANTDKLQQQINKNNHINSENIKDLQGKYQELENGKVDKDTFNDVVTGINGELGNKVDKDAFAAAQEDQKNTDNLQNDKIEANHNKINKVDHAVTEMQGDIEQAGQQIQANKSEIAQNKEDIKTNKENIGKLNSKVEDHEDRLNGIEKDFAQYDGRLSGLEKKVDNLDDKMNKGMSLMAAMNAVDFQNVQSGEMAIGAGIGHYGNAQSVAVGVAYAPTEDVSLNAKYSITAGDVDSFAVGAGASYKFKVGR